MKNFIISILFALLCVGAGMYIQQLRSKNIDAGTTEVSRIVKSISAFMELPDGEIPTLATVSDISKLPAIPLFARVKNGDKILIYPKNTKAIVYRPSTKKIIEVAVYESPSAQNVTNTSETAQQEKLTVTIRNGTSTVNLTSVYEKVVNEKIPELSVIEKESASRKNYSDTMIVPITSAGKKRVVDIAKILDIPTASTVPSGEATVSADLLIIVGIDKIGKS